MKLFPPKFDFDDFWVYNFVFGYAKHNCAGQRALGLFFEALGPFLRFLEGKAKRKEKIILKQSLSPLSNSVDMELYPKRTIILRVWLKNAHIEKNLPKIIFWALKCQLGGTKYHLAVLFQSRRYFLLLT